MLTIIMSTFCEGDYHYLHIIKFNVITSTFYDVEYHYVSPFYLLILLYTPRFVS